VFTYANTGRLNAEGMCQYIPLTLRLLMPYMYMEHLQLYPGGIRTQGGMDICLL